MSDAGRIITARPLSRNAFAPYGEVIDDTDWPHRFAINRGKCERYHALARVETSGEDAGPVISVFRAAPYAMPLQVDMVERHPLGSQAFVPLESRPFLVIVCPDENGTPGRPEAFLTRGRQGVNYFRSVWHGVLTPFGQRQDFLVVDSGGAEENLEEYVFDAPYEIRLAKGETRQV